MVKHDEIPKEIVLAILGGIILVGFFVWIGYTWGYDNGFRDGNQTASDTAFDKGYNECLSEFQSDLTACVNEKSIVTDNLSKCQTALEKCETPVIQKLNGTDVNEIVNNKTTQHIISVGTLSLSLSLILTLFSFKIDMDTGNRWLLFFGLIVAIITIVIVLNLNGIHLSIKGIPII